jgi:peptidoglycan/xylan/chitin deacetylase (PgdA/CDA1 family)
MKNGSSLRRAKQRLLNNRVTLAWKRRFLGTITSVETSEKLVALTFDDGPHPEFTPLLLETLERHNARGTFFMVGEAAQKHPDLVRRVAQGGHAIGNHTWDHVSLPSISGSERRKQIRACGRALAPFDAKLFRPPYGHQNLASRLDALLLGYKVVTWNMVAWDWEDKDADQIVSKLEKALAAGNVVCLHDSIYRDWPEDGAAHYDRMPMIRAVDKLLDRVGNAFRFATVPELLRSGRPVLRYWNVEKSEDWKSLCYRW